MRETYLYPTLLRKMKLSTIKNFLAMKTLETTIRIRLTYLRRYGSLINERRRYL